MGFPRILSVRDEVPGQQKDLCVDTTGASKDLENHLGSYLLSLLENSDANQTLQIEEVEKAFVPDLYNASSFLVPRLVYVLFTCNSSEDKQDVIDDERAFVWASEYLFVYMHPAVIRLVSLLDVTLLSPSVYSLRMCIPNVCSNTTEVFSFEETILKVSNHVHVYNHLKGVTLLTEYILYSDLCRRSKSLVKSQAKNLDKSKVKQ